MQTKETTRQTFRAALKAFGDAYCAEKDQLERTKMFGYLEGTLASCAYDLSDDTMQDIVEHLMSHNKGAK